MNPESHSDKTQNSEYDALLAATRDYVKVKPIDTPRTIYLVEKAKGARGYREFSAAVDTSIASISYILNKHSIAITKKLIAGLVSGAASESGVTLDVLMDAQGQIRKQYLDTFDQTYRGNIRRILIDDLLNEGFEVEFGKEYAAIKDPEGLSFTLNVKRLDKRKSFTFDFKIRTCPILNNNSNIEAMISTWLDETIDVNFVQKGINWIFLVVDNSTLYQEILEKVEQIRIPNKISIVLVSPQKRKVINEFMIPLAIDDKSAPFFSQIENEIIESVDYPFWEIYQKDARSLLSDKLLEKGCSIHLIDYESYQPDDEIGNIQPDFSFYVDGLRKKPFLWAFTLKPLSEDVDAAAVKNEVRAWVSQSIVYYYLGGMFDRLSLVVDNEQIYNYALEELSSLRIKHQISVIWISTLRGEIVKEYNVPSDSEKGIIKML